MQEEKWTTEDEMSGWHHWLDGREFEQALGVGDGQESLACCSPWGHKELDMTWHKLSELCRAIVHSFQVLHGISALKLTLGDLKPGSKHARGLCHSEERLAEKDPSST